MRRPSASDQDVGEQAADQAVEHDGLGEREAEPLDALELAAQLGLPGDGLDHRAEDVPDADTGAEGAEPDAEREGDRLARVGDRARSCEKVEHAAVPPSVPARSPSRCRWLTERR